MRCWDTVPLTGPWRFVLGVQKVSAFFHALFHSVLNCTSWLYISPFIPWPLMGGKRIPPPQVYNSRAPFGRMGAVVQEIQGKRWRRWKKLLMWFTKSSWDIHKEERSTPPDIQVWHLHQTFSWSVPWTNHENVPFLLLLLFLSISFLTTSWTFRRSRMDHT